MEAILSPTIRSDSSLALFLRKASWRQVERFRHLWSSCTRISNGLGFRARTTDGKTVPPAEGEVAEGAVPDDAWFRQPETR